MVSESSQQEDDRTGVTGEVIRTLYVDDDATRRRTTARKLDSASDEIAVVTEDNVAGALERLENEHIDCIVMQGTDGIGGLQRVRDQYGNVPFIIYTEEGAEAGASESISLGVGDYLQIRPEDDDVSVLAGRIMNVVDRNRDIERFQSFLESTPDAIITVDADGAVNLVNRRAVEMFGYDRQTLVGMEVEQLVAPQYRDEHRTHRENLFESSEARRRGTHLELFGLDADGFEFPVDVALTPVSNGAHTEVIIAIRDISTRKWYTGLPKGNAPTNRVELRREMTARLDRITDGFVALDHDWQFTYVNDTAETFLSVAESQVLGERIWDVLPELKDTDIGSAIRTAKESNEQTSVAEFFEPTGRWFELQIYPSRSGLSIYLQDVTDRRERERRYRAIFEQTYQFTGLMEPDGTLLEANQTALEFGGLEREDVVEKPIWEARWFQIDDETPNRIKDAVKRAAAGEFVRFDLTVQGEDRDAVIDFSIKPVLDETGEVTLLVPEGRDITELKEQQRELQRQNDRLEEFASVVSHDLRNPLTVARTNLALARNEREDEHLEHVAEALSRMNELIDDLLTLAQKGMMVSEKQHVSLDAVAERAWQTVETRGASLEVNSKMSLRADRERLRELFENLYRNAVEHADGDTQVTVGEFREGFYVADDGPGIPEETREQVFEPGYTTNEGGTGFGLAIVRNIAQAHGWDIRVTDSESGGARFEIQFDGD